MQVTSELYKALRRDINAVYEVDVIRGPIHYGMNKIKSCKIKQSLFSKSGPQIGCTVSTRCDIVLVEDTNNWERNASFDIRVRLVSKDGLRISEWIKIGKYYTDERHDDTHGNLTITSYDGMIKLERKWVSDVSEQSLPTSWPVTAKKAGEMIVEATGVELDPDTVLDDTIKFFPLNTEKTAREAWGDIAAASGGNCTMTAEGKIRIVPLNADLTEEKAIAGIAVTGVSTIGYKVTSNLPDTGIHYINMAVKKLDKTTPLSPVTGVMLETSSGTQGRRGDDAGFVLVGKCDYADTVAAQLCYSTTRGYVYRPFSATRATLDPAAELGDIVVINDDYYQVMTAEWTISKVITCNISAPYEIEADHEYLVNSGTSKTLKKVLYMTGATVDKKLSEFVDGEFSETIHELESQIDKRAETFYQEADPSAEWTADEKPEHIGDLWYRTTDSKTFRYNGNTWDEQNIPDSVFDKIDGKSSIYISQPTVPYYVGDLWFTSDGEILTCIASKTTGSFSQSDWSKKNKYTDDSRAEEVLVDAYSKIEQKETEILTTVGEIYATADNLSDVRREVFSEVNQKADEWSVQLHEVDKKNDDRYEDQISYLRYKEGVLELGKTGDATSLRQSNKGQELLVNEEVMYFVNQNEMMTPRKFRIPVGGSMQMGNYLWQPRSNGNLSLLWVGE